MRTTRAWQVAAVVAAVTGAAAVTVPVRGAESSPAAQKSVEDTAKAEWGKLSVQIKNETNLETIIGMHDRFLDKYADAAMAASVMASKEEFETLLKSGAAKFHGRWLAKDKLGVLQQQWRDDAAVAREFYRDGKFREALDAAMTRLLARGANPRSISIEVDPVSLM